MKYLYDREYDETDPNSIELYAQKLVGKTFSQILNGDNKWVAEMYREADYASDYENMKRKGGLGELIEERFFHYKCNNDSKPDFEKAGVELKVTPYKKNKNGSLSAKERLIITMIDYFSVINEKFEESHLWNKAKLILLVYYLYQQKINKRLDYYIGYAKLFTPPDQDVQIIKHDYEMIVNKIRGGKANELSEGDTLYLCAAPKAATSKDRRKQPYSEELAKPRAFAFKSSYMTYVLNNYIIPGRTTYEPIVKEMPVSYFEDYVIMKIAEYKDYSVEDLCKKLNAKFEKKPKNLEAMLAYRILGIKGNHAEEFVKANIVVKTIRVNSSNKIKENMSFPAFKFKELLKENWENSILGSYLSETKFLFVVYKFDKNQVLRLKGCQFWNIPYKDLNEEVYLVWEKTRQVLKKGLVIKKINGKNSNNFPKASENSVCHVRPHAIDSEDTDELPDGREYSKQCFWLKNSYILAQLDKKFIE